MISYYIFYIFIFISILLPQLAGKRNNLNYLVFPLIISILFAGLRGNVGTDTFAYKTFFNIINYNLDSYRLASGITFSFEPGFTIYTLIIKSIFNSDQFYIFSLSLLYGFLFYMILKKVKEKDLYFLFYISTYYIMLDFNLLRIGIALLLIGNAYLLMLNKEKGVLSYLFLAIFTHYTSLIVSFSFINKKNFFLYLFLFAIIFLIAFSFIYTKFLTYLQVQTAVLDLSKINNGLIIEFSLLLFLFNKNKDIYGRKFFIIILMYFIFKWFNYLNDFIDRFTYIFGFILYLYIFREKQSVKAKYVIYMLIFFNLYRTLMFINYSDAAMAKLNLQQPGSNLLFSQTSYLPYKFFWE